MTGRTDNLITGEPIVMKIGEAIGFPQIIAQEVPGYRGYYIGGGTFPQTPWAQIEFTNQRSKDVSEPFYFNDFYPLYGWLPTATQDALRDILYADANNPDSFRYEFDGLVDWLWRAEMDLWTVNGFVYDYSSIFSRLGSWWEDGPEGCSPGTTNCDEVFSIFPIIKTSPFYNPAMYDSANVSYLVHRWQADNVMGPGYKQHWEWGEVIDPSVPDDISGSIIIKWRIDHVAVTPTYQAISYHVFPSDRQLKIRWSSRVSDLSSIAVPSIPASSDICDGVAITCHSSEWWPW